MTGLPGLPAPPRGLPDLGLVTALVRDCRAGVAHLADADRSLSQHGHAIGWRGPSADVARAAADRRLHTLAETVLSAERAVRVVEDWAHRLVGLRAEREALLTRIDDTSAELARLALVPDDTIATPFLRAHAWERHRDLGAALEAWAQRVAAADMAAVHALDAPDPVVALATDHDPAHHRAAASTRRALAEAAAAGLPAYLLSYDPDAFDGDGEVVIAFGDPLAAEHTAIVVPGITHDAGTIDLQAVGALSLEAAMASRAGRSGRTSTIAWMGYDAPSHPALHGGRLAPRELGDLLRMAGEGAAEHGGHELAAFVDDLRGDNPDGDVTVIGHSYGSTTAAHAAVDGLAADRLVLLGSPGAGGGVDRAGDLRIPVFVAAADNDPVTWIGGAGNDRPLGRDPAQASFGAVRLAAEPGPEFHLDSLDQAVLNHNAYLIPGSASLDAVAAVTVDAPEPAVPGRTQPGDELLVRWAVREAAYDVGRLWP